jgi:hypothetical protein
MEFLLLFILAGVGITNLVVNASLLDYPRDFIIERSNILGKLITCMMCSGFWVGLLIGIFIGINPILAGATISLLSFTFGLFVEYMEIEMAVKASYLEDVEIVEDDDERI